jgi:CheY-like chemotaxis protein
MNGFAGNLSSRRLNVYLLEDSEEDERLAVRAMESCGLPLNIVVARNGEAALAALRGKRTEAEEAETPDLVISDLKMPKMNGDEVLERAKKDGALKDVPYVIFSSSDEDRDVKRCIELGATSYYVKPVGYEEYVTCLKGILMHWLTNKKAEPECLVETSNAS